MSNYAAPHQIADAIESLEWKGCSIGHKVILANAVAALRATQPAAGEPVYQYKGLSGEWIETKQAYYEYQKRHGWPVRILWTAPPAAAHGDEAVLDHPVIKLLLEVALSADHALDDTEDDGENLTWWRSSFERLSNAMDALAQLPDDQPDVVMGPAAKAAWALRGMTAMRAQAGEGGE